MTTGAPAPAPAAKPADHVKTAGIMLAVATVLILVGTISKSWIASPESDDVHLGPRGMEACMDSACVDVPTRGLDEDIKVMMTIAMISGFTSAAAAGVFAAMALARRPDWVVVPPGVANFSFTLAALSMTVFLVRMISEKGEVSWAGFAAIGGVIVAAAGLMTLRPHLGARTAGAPQHAQPMQPYGSQPYQQPYGNQSQPMQPYGNQSQPMQPYGNQSQPMQPYGNQSQPMQPQPQHGSQPYPNQPQPQYGSQPSPNQSHGNQSQPMQPQPQYGSQPYQQPQMAPPHAPPPQQQAAPSCPRCGTQLHFVAQYQRWFCPREQQYV